jgi:hypothetical protein
LFPDASRVWRKEDHAVRETGGLADIVGDEDDGLLACRPDFLEVAVKLLARHGVQCGERFVHEQHPGVRRQGTGQRHPLPHAAGKLVNVGVCVAFQTHELKVELGHFDPFLVVQIGLQLQAEKHVAQYVEPGKKRRLLEHHHAVAPRFSDQASVGHDGARVGSVESRDHIEQGGFPATAWTDEADKFALVHVQAHIVESMRLHHALAEPF